jgi:hypothetical protein
MPTSDDIRRLAAVPRGDKPTREEKHQIDAWRWGYITRAELEKRIGKVRADTLAPEKK